MLTAKQVCERLQCSRWTLQRLAKRGELVPVKPFGTRSVRYREFDVERWERRLRPAQ